MMLTCIFKHFKVLLDSETSLKSTRFDVLSFGRMGNNIVHSTRRRSQGRAIVEIYEESDREEPALKQLGENHSTSHLEPAGLSLFVC